MTGEKRLGELEQLALLSVLRLGETDGAAVRAELADRAERRVSVSTVYVTLMRLEGKGLLRSWLGEPTAEPGGKARRLFAIEPAGVEVARELRRIHARVWEGLDGELAVAPEEAS